VLVGLVHGDGKEVVRLVPAVNRRTDDPHRYLIAPDDLRRLESEARAAGLDVVGYYHSHPDHPAAPSAFDADHAWPWYSYVIVRIDRGRGADLTSWVLADDRPHMLPEPLDVFSEV
jgi:proteasome lid subunit RPN8/RPN11